MPAGGTYFVTGTNSSGCSSVDSIEIEFLSVLPATYVESITSIGLNQTAFNLTPGDPAGGAYSGDGIIGTSFHPGLAGIGTHAIVYSYTDGNGCISTDTTFIEVYDDLGISAQEENNWLVFPNPFQTTLQINVNEAVKIDVIDMLGRKIYNETIQSSKTINLNAFQNGIYNVKLSSCQSEKTRTYRLVKN